MMMAKEKPQKYGYTEVICILQMAFLYVYYNINKIKKKGL